MWALMVVKGDSVGDSSCYSPQQFETLLVSFIYCDLACEKCHAHEIFSYFISIYVQLLACFSVRGGTVCRQINA